MKQKKCHDHVAEQKEYRYLLVLLCIPIVLFLVQMGNGYVVGSQTDWISQHSVFPDYFRKLFYRTGNPFLQYAAEIGGGQNIYHFAYYGLYHPLLLLSFLLPFIKMTDYIQLMMLLVWMADGILCYFWLRSRVHARYAFSGSLVLVLSDAVVFHTATHIMFVDYLPFLLMAFLAYDHYQKTSKYGMLVLSVFLMILTSFYFAIGGLAALFFYIVCHWKKEQLQPGMQLIKTVWHSFYPLGIAVGLSLFYLLPVFFSLTGGRQEKSTTDFKSLLLPDVSLLKFFYSPYGIGLSVLSLLAVCTLLFWDRGKKQSYGCDSSTLERRLSISLFFVCIFPVFIWLLNGGLYVRNKALIPFLPLFCLTTAAFMQEVSLHFHIDKKQKECAGRKNDNGKMKISLLCGCTLTGGILLAGYLTGIWDKDIRICIILLDFLICIGGILVTVKWKKEILPYTLILVLLVTGAWQWNDMQSGLVTQKFLNNLEDDGIKKCVEHVVRQDGTQYRTEVRRKNDYDYQRVNVNRVWTVGQKLTTEYASVSHVLYQDFRKELGISKPSRNKLICDAVNDPIFLRIMGVKYLVGDMPVAGYQKKTDENRETYYENDRVAPLYYLTDQVIAEKQYKKLSWEEKKLLLLEKAVVKTQATSDVENLKSLKSLQQVTMSVPNLVQGKNVIKTNKDTIQIHAQTGQKVMISLSQTIPKGSYLFCSFHVKNHNPKREFSIAFHGEKNKLSSTESYYYNENETFHYTSLMTEATNKVLMEFGAGDYEIADVTCLYGQENKEENLYQMPLELTQTKNGNGMQGKYCTAKDQWLVTSIPYDDGFTIWVDGKRIEKTCVNTAFLGAHVPKGKHTIAISYQAKGSFPGLAMSSMVLIGTMLAELIKRRHRLKKAKS